MMTLTLNADVQLSSKPSECVHIAFLTPMTTAHISTGEMPTSQADLVFWRVLFPSFLEMSRETLAAPQDRYWYTFYVGYDVDDPILDRPGEMEAFAEHMRARLREAGIPLHRVGVLGYRLGDTVHAPSWAVSHLAQAAFDNGADYMYQINDDVKMLTRGWEDTLIAQLRRTHNLGITGPADVGMRRILTQSFAHRTHVDIFDAYFAAPFRNWYSDDWLTEVYGSRLTHRNHPVEVHHQTDHVGQRYPVHEARSQIHSQVTLGREKIRAYIQKHGLPQELL